MINPDKNSIYVFCRDFDTVTASNVNGPFTVDFTVNVPVYDSLEYLETVSAFTEVYEPDESGMVYIRDLGALMERYALRLGLRSLIQGPVLRAAGCRISFSMTTAQGGHSIVSSAQFLYASVKTGVDYSEERPKPFFLTRYRSRKVLPGQYCELSCINEYFHDQHIGVTAVYRDAPGHATATRWNITWDHAGEHEYALRVFYMTHPFGTNYIMTKLNELTERHYTADDLVEYYVTLYQSGEVMDSVHFLVDHTPFPDAVCLFYLNCYGLTETMVLRGIDTITADMEGLFGHVGDSYRKLHTDLDWEHESHTGALDKDGRAAFEDLIRSPKVYADVLDDDHEVVITETEAEEVIPHSAPTDFTVKWRLSDPACRKFGRTPTRKELGRIFDDSFDPSFE